MGLKTKFILYLIVIHGVILWLAYPQFEREQRYWFIAVEIGVLLSMWLGWRLYRRLMGPLELIRSGTEAIKDRDFQVKFKPTGQGELDSLINVYNGMIDELRNERIHQQEQNYFLEELINASPTGIGILDYEQRWVSANPALERFMTLPSEQVLGLRPDESPDPLLKQIVFSEGQNEKLIELDGWRKFKVHRGQFIHRGFNRQFVLVEELSREMIEAEKQAYGKVIRMMSHEVNNSMGSINSLLNSLVAFDTQIAEDLRTDYRESMDVVIRRNQSLGTFMNKFADVVRLPDPITEPLDIRELLHDLARLWRPICAEHHIDLIWEAPETALITEGDREQLEQVLTNAIKNARESIGEGGKIELFADPVHGLWGVADNGPGIPADKADRLFKPFFSTKKDGQGVGLTLSREVLMQHGFPFRLETDPDGLTRFEVKSLPSEVR
ncbi:HAMP domain-containing protein [Cryomorphaceae bacterium]|nr:HAMP domain-containing protein [Cryomorphaceae bacterium]